MGFFPQTIAAKLAGREVAASLLCFMDFKETPRRWWAGFGDLQAGGHTWQGTGELITIEGLEQATGTTAPRTTFTLSGIDATIVSLARNASDRVKDRACRVYIQFFEISPTNGAVHPWSPLDMPYAVWSGLMDQMTYAAEGPAQRSVTLTAESIWTGRRKPAYGRYTDRDQNARFPGDRGLEQLPDLIQKTIRWPVYVLAAALCAQALSVSDLVSTLGTISV